MIDLQANGSWIKSKNDYLISVKAFSRKVRGTMVAVLRAAHTSGELNRITRPGVVNVLMASPRRVSRTPALNYGLPTKYFVEIGLPLLNKGAR